MAQPLEGSTTTVQVVVRDQVHRHDWRHEPQAHQDPLYRAAQAVGWFRQSLSGERATDYGLLWVGRPLAQTTADAGALGWAR